VSIDLEFLSALSNLSFYIFGAHVLPHLLPSFVQFVFYSILVAQASQRGATTAITSFVAILTGLCATLFLVTVYRKALPALRAIPSTHSSTTCCQNYFFINTLGPDVR
jgi:hypothetical protein